jgi:hypothetical protein
MNKQDVNNLTWFRDKLLRSSRNKKLDLDFRCGVSYALGISYVCWNQQGKSNLPVKRSNAPREVRETR